MILSNVKAGDDVGRDLAVRAEQTYVKLTSAAPTKTEADAIREEWTKNRLNKHGGPTVMPPRPNDVCNMQGSDLGGVMPRRGDFDIEWDNEAESLLQDMEFLPTDSKEDVEMKLKVLQIYNSRLDNRNNWKQFLIDRNLLDYRKKHIEENKLPADERDLVNRMRLFARFQSPKEHEDLIQNLLKAKRMRKEIAKLQMYRRMGFTSMADAERFELNRNRREIDRIACEQREKEEKAALEAMSDGEGGGLAALSSTELNAAYLKQYKQNDRVNKRKSTSAPELMDGDAKNENVDDAIADGNVDSQSKAEVDQLRKPTFDVRKCEGFELLTKKELDLCQKLELEPKLYNEAKAEIIYDLSLRLFYFNIITMIFKGLRQLLIRETVTTALQMLSETPHKKRCCRQFCPHLLSFISNCLISIVELNNFSHSVFTNKIIGCHPFAPKILEASH
jgi:hypothetical protein